VGGIEINSEILAHNFVKLGADIHLLTKTKIQRNDDKIFPFKIIRNPNIITQIKEFLWADIVFINHLTLRMTLPLFFIKRKYIVTICGLIDKPDSWSVLKKIKKWHLAEANAVIAISQKIRTITFEKSIVIGNPYRSDLFKIDNNIKRVRDFVFLGRLCYQKGCDMAIEVLHLLNQNSSKYNLTIIGDGDEMNKLKRMAEKYDLIQYIRFTHILRGNDLIKCLNEHKYLLVPSRSVEGFGNIVLEGMACGCLPIVSDNSGLVDAVGNAGVTFQKENIQSLLFEVNEILHNADLEHEIRNNANNHLKKHTPENVAKLYYDVIKGVLENE
jgi:glycosyltransferase involved in cell wall biosynthesis